MTAGPEPLGAGRDVPVGGAEGPWLTRRVLLLAALAVAAGFVLGRRLLVPGPPGGTPTPPAPAPTPIAATGPTTGPGARLFAEVGQPAPPFTLDTPEGTPMSLADLRGRPVLLNFFATWCTPCRVEMPHLQQAWAQHEAHGLVVLGVDVQEQPEQVPPYLQELGLTFPVVVDGAGAVADQYRVSILPTSYFIDRDGRIARRRVGYFARAADLAQELSYILPSVGTPPPTP